MFYNFFNQQSRTMIQNITNNFKAHPMFKSILFWIIAMICVPVFMR